MTLRRSIILLLRWHRRIALIVALFLILLAGTGILINHAPDFGLDKTQIHSSLLARWYGIEQPELVGFKTDNEWIIHDGIQSLYLNQKSIGHCAPPLRGALPYRNLLLALCEGELLLIAPDGTLLERINSIFGLPQNSHAIALSNNRVLLKTTQNTHIADIESLEWQITPTADAIHWAAPASLPVELRDYLEQKSPGISLERFLLDLHSGRLFGSAGVYLMDAMAILFIVLALSGIWAWINYLRLNKENREADR